MYTVKYALTQYRMIRSTSFSGLTWRRSANDCGWKWLP